MIVLVITACPAGLRGQLTRWLLEIAPGVFVGRASRRVRELLWTRVVELAKNGRAILVFTARNEQRLDFRVHDSEWEPVDFDGVHLMRRPAESETRRGKVRRVSQGVDWEDDWSADRGGGLELGGAADVETGGTLMGDQGRAVPIQAGWSSASRRRRAARIRAASLRGPSGGEDGGSAHAK